MRRLSAIPGVGFITAHAIVAAIGDGRQFARGRDFAAWAGMTPRQHSSAGKRRAPGLSRQGEGRLRKLFALGATTLMRNARLRQDRATVWQRGLMARRPMKVAIIAQAAKTAKIAWAVLSSGKPYTPRLHNSGIPPPLGHAHGMSSSMRDAGQRLTELVEDVGDVGLRLDVV